MTTNRIEIRTPALPVPTISLGLHLRRVRAVLVLQLSPWRDDVVHGDAEGVHGARRDASARRARRARALDAAAERIERDRVAAQSARLGTL